MVPTRLLTKEGMYLITVVVPAFRIPAEVLVWGSRIFVWNSDLEEYREGMGYWIAPSAVVSEATLH